jgi:hypothetical protein
MKGDFNINHMGLSPTEFTEWQIDTFYEMFNFFKYRANITENLRFKEIPRLLHSYLVEGKIKKRVHDDLIQQLQSPDPENWLVALGILKHLKDVQRKRT